MQSAWAPFIRRPDKVPCRGLSAKDTLKFDAGDYVGISIITICHQGAGVELLKAGAKDHRSDFDLLEFFPLIVADGLGLADLDALVTVRAHAAVQAALSFRLGFRRSVAAEDLLQPLDALHGRKLRYGIRGFSGSPLGTPIAAGPAGWPISSNPPAR